jgi:hypothetical protein
MKRLECIKGRKRQEVRMAETTVLVSSLTEFISPHLIDLISEVMFWYITFENNSAKQYIQT